MSKWNAPLLVLLLALHNSIAKTKSAKQTQKVRITGIVSLDDGRKRKPFANASVYLLKTGKLKCGKPETPVILVLQRGKFTPQYACVQVDQPLIIQVRGKEAHRVAVSSRYYRRPGQARIPDKKLTIKFTKPEEAVALDCVLHADESAWISVVPNPWHDISQPTGKFLIDASLPPGQYVVRAYFHEFGRVEKRIVVRKDTIMLKVDLTFRSTSKKESPSSQKNNAYCPGDTSVWFTPNWRSRSKSDSPTNE